MSKINNKKVSPKSEKTIEEIYQKIEQREHILLRPDSYVGDVKQQKEMMWIYDDALNRMTKKEIEYSPALYKIYDEILVNARDRLFVDETCDTIKVNISKEKNKIEVYNNGNGIPIVMHKEHNIMLPELLFGNLLSSSNYDDTEDRITGGRNGYGAKLANIYSKMFCIETVDSNTKQRYTQYFYDNMSRKDEPYIESVNIKSYTKILFEPDLERFYMTNFTDDLIALMKKRAYDICASARKKVKVYFNDVKIDIPNFKKYMELYYPIEEMEEQDNEIEDNETEENDTETESINETEENDTETESINKVKKREIIYDEPNDRWRIGVIYVPDSPFEQISLVNGISTFKGGSHVKYVMDMIIKELDKVLKKKYKDLDVKAHQFKENMVIFIDSIIVNPSFDSQTKEFMKTTVSEYGSKCELKPSTITKIVNSGILDNVIKMAQFKLDQLFLKTSDGKKESKINIPKLDDAEYAGTKRSNECILILTEGDSAKTLAISGRPMDSKTIGIFPLKGKLLNVKTHSVKKYKDNEEIIAIKKILGLKQNVEYKDTNELRYGKILLLTDRDLDGFHIKGLLINFIHCFWPSLLKTNNFICTLETPIVVASKGKIKNTFYNLNDYENFKNNTVNVKSWTIKYYKGLATHTREEAKEIFNDYLNKLIKFKWDGDDDINNNIINLAFSKDGSNDRKKWLCDYDEKDYADTSNKTITYPDFINKELKHFSNSDNIRSIPSMLDGFKPSQRKIIYCAFKRKLFDEIRVAQFAGYVSEHSAYHHGEASLYSTIIGLAQNYTGSNNINLLEPVGSFGTILLGGKDHGSPRYIHTKLNKLTMKIYREEDMDILEYNEEDGYKIEPKYYIPIIPMLLVNGGKGIGTGYSTDIPCYNPIDIVSNIYNRLDNKEMFEMIPWYNHFRGKILKSGNNYEINGLYEKIDDTTVEIIELPVGTWVEKYITNVLNKNMYDTKTKTGLILDRSDKKGDLMFRTKLTMDENKLTKMILSDKFNKDFKLIKPLSVSNIWAYDSNNKLKHYNNTNEIIKEFVDTRLKYYSIRKNYLLGKMNRELDILKYRKLFIEGVAINKNIIVVNRNKEDIRQQLIKLNFPELSLNNEAVSYNYLLEMAISTLTKEKIEELISKYNEKLNEIKILEKLTEVEIYKKELIEFMDEYNIWLINNNKPYEEEAKNLSKIESIKSKPKSKGKSKTK